MEERLFIIGCIILLINISMILIRKYYKPISSNKLFKDIYSWVDAGWTSLIASAFIMFFLIQAFKIPSGSMNNTLIEGDHIFVNKFIYGIRRPFLQTGNRYIKIQNIKRGDIVVFQCPPKAMTVFERSTGITKDFIKRCVGIAGDTIEIKNNKLFVNGKLIYEPYVISINENHAECNNFGPIVIPQGHYMMLGDNRDVSFDSRFWGTLPDKYIKGKAFCIYWPISRWRLL